MSRKSKSNVITYQLRYGVLTVGRVMRVECGWVRFDTYTPSDGGRPLESSGPSRAAPTTTPTATRSIRSTTRGAPAASSGSRTPSDVTRKLSRRGLEQGRTGPFDPDWLRR
jgi:hypothetical protein